MVHKHVGIIYPITNISKYTMLFFNDISYPKVFVTHSNENIGKHLNLFAYKSSSSINTSTDIDLINNLMYVGNNKKLVKAWNDCIRIILFVSVYAYTKEQNKSI